MTFKLYAYGKDGKLTEVPEDLWKIPDRRWKDTRELSEDTLYEVHVTVEDGVHWCLAIQRKRLR